MELKLICDLLMCSGIPAAALMIVVCAAILWVLAEQLVMLLLLTYCVLSLSLFVMCHHY